MEEEKHYNFKDRTGEEIHSPSLGDVKIIAYRGTYDCDILVIDTEHILKNISYGNIKLGCVRNPFLPVVFGKGFMGQGEYSSLNLDGSKTKEYNAWKVMLERCYRLERSNRNKSYASVIVCEEWHNFQNFAKWFEENYIEGFQLDKDILSTGVKIYSPETCCFVPQEINIFFIKESVNVGNYPVGVHLNKRSGSFISRITKFGKRFSLGSYKTVLEAKEAYDRAKEQYAKELAEKWKDNLNENIYNILINFKCDDKYS